MRNWLAGLAGFALVFGVGAWLSLPLVRRDLQTIFPGRSERSIRLDMQDRTVRITFEGGGQGSGFILRNGLVLTAAHVVEGATSVTVELFPGGRIQRVVGDVLVSDAEEDLALLCVPEARGSPLPWAPVELLDHIFHAGCPRGATPFSLPGEVSRLHLDILGRDYFQESAPLGRGSSGGPVFKVVDGRPVLVGILVRARVDTEHMGCAIPAERVLAFLDGVLED